MMGVKEDVLRSLTIELEITEGERFNAVLLQSKVDNAYREVQTARNYPSSYTEAAIERDMENYYSQIRAVAQFDYNQIGAEGQTSFSEDGSSIHYVDRDSLFAGVLPIAKRG